MTEPVVHDTITVERHYPHPPERVFEAWADADQRARWHVPGDDHVLHSIDQRFEVGGHERASFGPPGGPVLREEGVYLDIVPGRRIVSAGTMHRDDVRISSTLCTVELMPKDGGTTVKLTDQSAFYDGRESTCDRRMGWGKVMDRLGGFLR